VLLELARGGMGKVYLARTRGPGGVERLVAIKRAHEQQPERGSQILADRLLDEACMAAHVHHSNVVGVHQAGSDEGGYYLVLDYVEGESLKGLIDATERWKKRLPPRIVLRVVCDALAGLHAAHEATDAHGRSLGILHRDVSTHNLLVGRDGVTRLTDFGIAKSAVSRVVTAEHYVQGKLVYMPPEYLRREPVDRTLDVYAMGVTFWIAATGKSPWPGAAEAQLVHSIVIRGVPSFLQREPEFGPEIAAVIDRACHLDATKRFQTAREMLDALEAAASTIGGLARPVEVAELVEALVGRELSERRKLVKARREAMDGAPEDAASQVVLSRAPSGPASALALNDAGPVALPVPTGVLRSRWEEPLPWRAALVVMALGAALLVGVLALRRALNVNDDARANRPSVASYAPAVSAAPPLAAQPEASPAAIARTAPSSDSQRSEGPARSLRRNQRAQLGAAPPKTAPFSSVNPYR
jgi:eukaryotic-like serine/threonine-protein kinase